MIYHSEPPHLETPHWDPKVCSKVWSFGRCCEGGAGSALSFSWSRLGSNGGNAMPNIDFQKTLVSLLLMDKILHHQGWWLSHHLYGFNHPRWCRISSINSSTLYFVLIFFAVACILVLCLQLWFVQRCGSKVFVTGSKGMIYGLVRSWRKDPNPSRFHYVKSQQRDAVSLEFFVKVTILTLQQLPYISKCRGCAEVQYRYLFFNCLMM